MTGELVICAFLGPEIREGTAYGNGLVRAGRECGGSGQLVGVGHDSSQLESTDPDASPAVYLVVAGGRDRGACTTVGICRRHDERGHAALGVAVRDRISCRVPNDRHQGLLDVWHLLACLGSFFVSALPRECGVPPLAIVRRPWVMLSPWILTRRHC